MIFGVFRVKNHDFTAKNHIFSNFRGGGASVPPSYRDPSLVLMLSFYLNVDTNTATAINSPIAKM